MGRDIYIGFWQSNVFMGEWMLDIQLGRRNLSPIQRIAVTEKYRPIYERQAQENQSKAGGDKKSENYKKSIVTNSSQVIFNNKERNPTVRKILSDAAGVSEDTYSKGKKILDSDNEKLKQEVLLGEKSINAGYKELTQDLIETNIRQRGIGNPNPIKLGRCIKELERIYGIHQGNGSNQYEQNPKVSDNAKTQQEELADMIGISVDTLNNYKKLTELVPELQDWVETGILAPTTVIDDDLQDENSKLRALISNNFGRRKNDPAKDRKALETYVSLRGYKQGEIGRNHFQDFQNGKAEKMTLEEIAKELNMSKRNLQRALRSERNLTDSMKELHVYYVLIISCVKDFGGDL